MKEALDTPRRYFSQWFPLVLILSAFLLSACTPLLERQYSTAEPHSRKFWESEAAGTLRAETYQDIVNDLLLLIGQHTESATLRLYNFVGDLTVSDTLEKAAVEIQNETPLGSYAVSYITSTSQAQRGYYEVRIQIGYRRTAEQLQAIVSATSPEAVYALLQEALEEDRSELTVRIGYWTVDGRTQVEQAVELLRKDRLLTETPPWQIHYYPQEGAVGMIEFMLIPPETEPIAESEADAQAAIADFGDSGTREPFSHGSDPF